MSDDVKIRGPEDRSRINMQEEHEVRYWTKELGISKEQLEALVKQVGPSISAIRAELASD